MSMKNPGCIVIVTTWTTHQSRRHDARHNTNNHTGRLATPSGEQRAFTVGVHQSGLVMDTFNETTWRARAQHIIATEAF